MRPYILVLIIAGSFAAGVAWGRRRGAWGVGLGRRRVEVHPPRKSHAGYSFTDDVRNALGRSREEAGLLGNEYVGAEHILLGLIHANAGNGTRVLERLHIDAATLRSNLLAVVKRGAAHTAADLPYTSRAKRVLENAMVAARDLGHNYVGTEHLLLGLAQDTGVAGQALADAGADEQAVRRETLALLSED